MNTLKKSIALFAAIFLTLFSVGCSEKYDDYDSFKPAGVYIVDRIGDEKYETDIDNADYAQKMLDEFKKLNIDTDTEGEMGSAYLYMRFYDENEDTFLIFTIYENGSCCLGEDYEDFYKVTDGRQKYIDLCDLYSSFEEK